LDNHVAPQLITLDATEDSSDQQSGGDYDGGGRRFNLLT
jgi:hypothetical protein